jgi:hypothetical protein
MPRAIGGDNYCSEFELISDGFCEGADRELTATAQCGERGTFAAHSLTACLVIEFGADAAGFIVFASFNGERALSGSRTELLRRQNFGNFAFETKAAQAGYRQQNGIVAAFFQLAETRIDVAAHGLDDEIRPEDFELSGAAPGTGTDNRAGAQILKAAADHGVARVFPFGDGGDRESRRSFRGQVFQAVHREIDMAGEQRFFDFFREEALAARLN